MQRKISSFFNHNSYLIFLITLVFWIGFLPLLQITGYVEFLEFIISNLIIISAFYFFSRDNRKFLSWIFIPFTLVFEWLSYFYTGNSILGQAARLSMLILLFLITVHFMQIIFRRKEIDLEVIYISIAGYIMIGLMTSILCWFTHLLYPGSYNIPVDTGGPIFEFIYYSIVTMSTLGYGDVLPLSAQSKSLAIIIILLGQFYMTLLMAFLIGKYLNQSHGKN